MNLPILQSEVKTMSSREIADLCGARHNDVIATIERLFSKGLLRESRKTLMEYISPNGGRPTMVYDLTKTDTMKVVSGYNDEVRSRIIDRWQELENKELSKLEILQMALQSEQERIALENKVEQLQPKADALDVISAASNSLNIRETAKTLDIQEKKFIAWCINHDWLYRDSKAKLCPISHRIQSGFLEQRAVSYIKPNSEVGVSTQAMFTARALTHLAKIFAVVKEVV